MFPAKNLDELSFKSFKKKNVRPFQVSTWNSYGKNVVEENTNLSMKSVECIESKIMYWISDEYKTNFEIRSIKDFVNSIDNATVILCTSIDRSNLHSEEKFDFVSFLSALGISCSQHASLSLIRTNLFELENYLNYSDPSKSNAIVVRIMDAFTKLIDYAKRNVDMGFKVFSGTISSPEYSQLKNSKSISTQSWQLEREKELKSEAAMDEFFERFDRIRLGMNVESKLKSNASCRNKNQKTNKSIEGASKKMEGRRNFAGSHSVENLSKIWQLPVLEFAQKGFVETKFRNEETKITDTSHENFLELKDSCATKLIEKRTLTSVDYNYTSAYKTKCDKECRQELMEFGSLPPKLTNTSSFNSNTSKSPIGQKHKNAGCSSMIDREFVVGNVSHVSTERSWLSLREGNYPNKLNRSSSLRKISLDNISDRSGYVLSARQCETDLAEENVKKNLRRKSLDTASVSSLSRSKFGSEKLRRNKSFFSQHSGSMCGSSTFSPLENIERKLKKILHASSIVVKELESGSFQKSDVLNRLIESIRDRFYYGCQWPNEVFRVCNDIMSSDMMNEVNGLLANSLIREKIIEIVKDVQDCVRILVIEGPSGEDINNDLFKLAMRVTQGFRNFLSTALNLAKKGRGNRDEELWQTLDTLVQSVSLVSKECDFVLMDQWCDHENESHWPVITPKYAEFNVGAVQRFDSLLAVNGGLM